jgi:3'(2'), 5'-bisphosphate nucleotidase
VGEPGDALAAQAQDGGHRIDVHKDTTALLEKLMAAATPSASEQKQAQQTTPEPALFCCVATGDKDRRDAMQQELETASELAAEAGRLVLRYYEQPSEVEWKHAGHPVTQADRAASEFLVKELKSRFPDDAVVSEEEIGDQSRLSKSRVWMIDPIDGTREFIEHIGEYSVMIGLALDGVAAVGVIYQPVADKLYCAATGVGALLTERGTTTALRVSEEADPRRMVIAVSRSHPSAAVESVRGRLGITESVRMGSLGLKVGLVCERLADLYLDMSGRTSQWDTCAAAALIEEAGGRMTDLKGRPLRYNTPDLRHRDGVIASNGAIHDRIVEAAGHV